MQVNFQGAISEVLSDYFMINDSFTIGQKMAQIEKTAKKRFIYLTDKETYETIKYLLKNDYYSDTYYTQEELDNEF